MFLRPIHPLQEMVSLHQNKPVFIQYDFNQTIQYALNKPNQLNESTKHA
jgi:hypothetical protein